MIWPTPYKWFLEPLKKTNRGFTHIELIVGMVLLTISIFPIINFLKANIKQTTHSTFNMRAIGMAEDIMSQISTLRWDESGEAGSAGTTAIGVDAGETAGYPNTFDDIDDYNDYMETDGSYVKSVEVRYCNLPNMSGGYYVQKILGVGMSAFKQITVVITTPSGKKYEVQKILANVI